MAFVLVSCNQKNKEASTDHSNMMSNDSTMMDNDSITINDKNSTMENHEKMYACPMHPEVQQIGPGSCPICGMALEGVILTIVGKSVV